MLANTYMETSSRCRSTIFQSDCYRLKITVKWQHADVGLGLCHCASCLVSACWHCCTMSYIVAVWLLWWVSFIQLDWNDLCQFNPARDQSIEISPPSPKGKKKKVCLLISFPNRYIGHLSTLDLIFPLLAPFFDQATLYLCFFGV